MSQLLDPRDDPDYKNKTRAELYTQLVAAQEEADDFRADSHNEIRGRQRAEDKLKDTESENAVLQKKLHDLRIAIETAMAMRFPDAPHVTKAFGYVMSTSTEYTKTETSEELNLLQHLHRLAT
jgi:hypothetical protein